MLSTFLNGRSHKFNFFSNTTLDADVEEESFKREIRQAKYHHSTLNMANATYVLFNNPIHMGLKKGARMLEFGKLNKSRGGKHQIEGDGE